MEKKGSGRGAQRQSNMREAEAIHYHSFPDKLAFMTKPVLDKQIKKPSCPALYELTLLNRIVVETSKHDCIQHQTASMASMRARRTSIQSRTGKQQRGPARGSAGPLLFSVQGRPPWSQCTISWPKKD